MIMCGHIWKVVSGLRICPKCGMTVRMLDGKTIIDRKLPGMLAKKGKGRK